MCMVDSTIGHLMIETKACQHVLPVLLLCATGDSVAESDAVFGPSV
jgi:hypothetical protein